MSKIRLLFKVLNFKVLAHLNNKGLAIKKIKKIKNKNVMENDIKNWGFFFGNIFFNCLAYKKPSSSVICLFKEILIFFFFLIRKIRDPIYNVNSMWKWPLTFYYICIPIIFPLTFYNFTKLSLYIRVCQNVFIIHRLRFQNRPVRP